MSAGADVKSRLFDVAVVGGGPVGLAAAIEAALAGLEVVVVEPRALLGGTDGDAGIDKACGEGLMPGALAAVQRLGIDPKGFAVTGITYIAASGRRVEHDFMTGPGRGVRRTALSRALAERAASLGARMVRARVTGLAQDGAGVALTLGPRSGGYGEEPPRTLRARWVLAADGLHSGVRAMAGVSATTDGRRYGVRRHVGVAPWSDHVEVYWGPSVEAYVTPVAAGEVGIAIEGRRGHDLVLGRGVDGEAADVDASAGPLAQLPALRERLAGARWTSSARGAGPLRQQVSARSAGRVLMVGDAGGYVDALTGEGLRVGLASAGAAVAAISGAGAETPARAVGDRYERAWSALSRDYRVLTSGLVSATRHRPVREALVPVAAAVPAVFGAVVERLAR